LNGFNLKVIEDIFDIKYIKERFNQFLITPIDVSGIYWETGEIWIQDRKKVYERFREVFQVKRLDFLQKYDFLDFLQFRTNFSWTGLPRVGNKAVEDMDRLRNALKTLFDENQPIIERINKVVKRSGTAHVRGLGKNISTGLLMIQDPNRYGVMNRKSIEAISVLGVNFKLRSNLGKSYEIFNELLLALADKIGTDLVYLDGFFWFLCKDLKKIQQASSPSLKQLEKTFQLKQRYQKARIKDLVLVMIDGPNSLGKNYNDRLDLKQVRDYAYSMDTNANIYYLTKIQDCSIDKKEISRLGYKILESHKDIDYLMRDEIREKLKTKSPPNILILGTKDQDFLNFIKDVKKEHDIKIILAISSSRGLAESLIPVVDDIQFFPEKKQANNIIEVKIMEQTPKGTYIARHPDGKIVFIRAGIKLLNDEEVLIQITGENPKKTVYFANFVRKIE